MKRELTRNTANKMIGGVVSGIHRTHLPQMDLTLLRALVAIGTLLIPPLTAVLLPAYLILWVVMPDGDRLQLQA